MSEPPLPAFEELLDIFLDLHEAATLALEATDSLALLLQENPSLRSELPKLAVVSTRLEAAVTRADTFQKHSFNTLTKRSLNDGN